MNTNETNQSHGNSRRDFFKQAGTGLGVAAVVATGTAGVVCALNPTPKPIVESTIGKAVRRVKQTIVPTQAVVRYDSSVGMWAVLDSKLKPVRHFASGMLTNVNFRSERVSKHVSGCGGGNSTEFAGIAEGTLRENHSGTPTAGYRNLKFKDGSFRSYDDQHIFAASTVILMPERHAMYLA